MFNNESCLMVVMKDVTESMSLNSLKIINEMMRILQASVSHDMRAPLQSISNAIDLALSSGRIPSDIADLLKPIGFSSKFLKI
jgi:signal transduction histidine kinase